MSINPYEPPLSEMNVQQEQPQWQEHRLWRSGVLLVVGNNALLPSLCFKTGQPTDDYYCLKKAQRPGWLYLLLLFGILPYFVAAPRYERFVELQIPLNRQLAASLRRLERIGMSFLAFFVVVFPIATWTGVRPIIIPLVMATAAFSLNLLFAKSRLDIDIVSIDRDHIALRGVHQSILSGLPSFTPNNIER